MKKNNVAKQSMPYLVLILVIMGTLVFLKIVYPTVMVDIYYIKHSLKKVSMIEICRHSTN